MRLHRGDMIEADFGEGTENIYLVVQLLDASANLVVFGVAQ